jgi:hypothetical protein
MADSQSLQIKNDMWMTLDQPSVEDSRIDRQTFRNKGDDDDRVLTFYKSCLTVQGSEHESLLSKILVAWARRTPTDTAS